MPVGELLRRIDSRELTEWMAYERVAGPLGPERADLHAAIVAATVANAMRGKKGRPFKPADFMPQWDRPSPVEQTGDDHLRIVKQLQAAFGGGQVRTRRRGGDSNGDTG